MESCVHAHERSSAAAACTAPAARHTTSKLRSSEKPARAATTGGDSCLRGFRRGLANERHLSADRYGDEQLSGNEGWLSWRRRTPGCRSQNNGESAAWNN